jgi:protein SCO1/2
MMTFRSLWVVAVAIPLALAGCSANTTSAPGSADYEIKGKVMAVNSDKSLVKLDHEDIPGLMPAMEMEFHVENAKMLDGLKVGDQVQGRLKKTDSGYLITRLEKR